MKTIIINGKRVKIAVETFYRIARFAEERKITLPAAISFLLEKVI